MEKNYFKKGAQVIYHFKVWQKVMWSKSGYGYVPRWKRAVIVSPPRDEYGKFTNNFDWPEDVTVTLKDEDGKVFTSTLDEIEPDVDPATLSKKELRKLWNEISHGSMYYSDYRNSLGVFENIAMNAYEGYFESLREELSDEEAEEKECADGFVDYCLSVECFRETIAA